jgi:LysM repeat protein
MVLFSGGDGAEIIYALRNTDTFARKIAKEFESNGQNVRKFYQKRLPSDPSKDYYYIIRDTPNNETVIVEYGFADSTGDDVDLLKNDWEQLAEGVVKAITEYAGGTYVPQKGTDYYRVQSGDSLWSIAKKYNVLVSDLKTKNNLTSNLLKVGQILYIPTIETQPAETPNTYTVKSGDSLYSIANKFDTTVTDLKTVNNLSSNLLNIGQILKLPVKSETQLNSYTVKSGDNLYTLAKNFNTTINDLKTLNNLTSDSLSVGQVLKIPTNYKTYIVVSGDSLYSIAKKFATTVSTLESLNNLSTSTLSIGQKLLIP